MTVEICCNSYQSAVNAQKGGADRVELCANLEVGGVTPADEDIRKCVELGIRTHVLVRPRGGNFCYTDAEVEQIRKSILRCKVLGAHAVVIGFLTDEGKIDTDLTKEMVQLASPMEVTFHRAFDEIKQSPQEALEAVIATGCTRILTSGCRPTAIEGADTICQLVKAANGRIAILAGSGVAPENVAQLIRQTGVGEVHGSCKHQLADGTIETDTEIVEQLIKYAKQ